MGVVAVIRNTLGLGLGKCAWPWFLSQPAIQGIYRAGLDIAGLSLGGAGPRCCFGLNGLTDKRIETCLGAPGIDWGPQGGREVLKMCSVLTGSVPP